MTLSYFYPRSYFSMLIYWLLGWLMTYLRIHSEYFNIQSRSKIAGYFLHYGNGQIYTETRNFFNPRSTKYLRARNFTALVCSISTCSKSTCQHIESQIRSCSKTWAKSAKICKIGSSALIDSWVLGTLYVGSWVLLGSWVLDLLY